MEKEKPKNISEAASLMGRKGGKQNAKKGVLHMKKIGKLGAKARWKGREKYENVKLPKNFGKLK